MAFLDTESKTGVSYTRCGGGTSEPVSLCEAHNAWHYVVRQRDQQPVHQRFSGLPAEVVSHLKRTATLGHSLGTGTIIRLGVTEDFETQPVPLVDDVRGVMLPKGVTLSTKHARSGTRSIEIASTAVFNYPQIVLEPHSTYALVLELKVTGTKKGGCSVSAGTYEWSPAETTRGNRTVSEVVAPSGKWQPIHLELKTGSWDPFLEFAVTLSEGITACVDDFCLAKVR